MSLTCQILLSERLLRENNAQNEFCAAKVPKYMLEKMYSFFNAAITINHRIFSIQKCDGKVNMNKKFKFSIKFYKK